MEEVEKFESNVKSDTLMACFSLFLYGNELRENRLKIRAQLLDYSDSEEFKLINKRESFISDKFAFCKLFANLHHVTIHLGDTIIGKGPDIHLIEEGGRFYLMKRTKEETKEVFFHLWTCLGEGKAVQSADIFQFGPNIFRTSVSLDENVLYTVIPNGKLWRHVLEKGKILCVFCDRTCVSEQEYHGKTNPYFYPPNTGVTNLTLVISTSLENATMELGTVG